MNKEVSDTIASRGSAYGDYSEMAEVAQGFKKVMQSTPGWSDVLTPGHREALELIATKMARILNGNPYHDDTWLDIAGYAILAKDLSK